MFIEECRIMTINLENAPLIKIRNKIYIEETILIWKKLIKGGWQKI